MCHILDFEPSKNDGSFHRVAPLLKEWECKQKKEKERDQAKNKTNFGSIDDDPVILNELRSNDDDKAEGEDEDEGDPIVCK